MKPQVRLRSLPEMYAASKPPAAEPAATAATMSPANCGGMAGMPGSFTKLIWSEVPRAVAETLCNLVANASAGGPIAAEALKLRNLISSARAMDGVRAARAIAHAIPLFAAARISKRDVAMTSDPPVGRCSAEQFECRRGGIDSSRRFSSRSHCARCGRELIDRNSHRWARHAFGLGHDV